MKSRVVKWVFAAACLAGFIAIALNLDSVSALDGAVYGVVSGWISPAATAFFLGCTQLVSPVLLLVLSLVLVATAPKKEYRIPILINLCVAILLNIGLKHVFTRARPTEVLHIVTETGFSFPSGHSMAAACFYGFLIFLVRKLCKNKALRLFGTLGLGLLIALVCVSRVYLGAHYATDVLAGALVSACYLVVFTSLVDAFFQPEKRFRQLGITPNGRNQLLFSFVHAFEGVAAGFRSERNLVIHFSAMATVVVFGSMLGLSKEEWIACVVLFGVVISAELMNTAVETVVDMICPERDERAKHAKDTAAGAVLMVALAAAAVGVIIFAPKLWAILQNEL